MGFFGLHAKSLPINLQVTWLFFPSVSKNINAQTVIFCSQYLTSNNVAPKARQKTIGPAKSVSFMMLPSATFNGCSTVSVFCQMWSKLIPNSTSYMKRVMHIYFTYSPPVAPICFTLWFPCLSTFKSPADIFLWGPENGVIPSFLKLLSVLPPQIPGLKCSEVTKWFLKDKVRA